MGNRGFIGVIVTFCILLFGIVTCSGCENTYNADVSEVSEYSIMPDIRNYVIPLENSKPEKEAVKESETTVESSVVAESSEIDTGV